jgi:hypothetical protein
VALGGGPSSFAADVNTVATAFEPGNRWDLNLRLGYRYESTSAAIRRQAVDTTAPASFPTPVANDLYYRQSRHILDLRADVGLLQDLWFQVNAPLVLSDRRTFTFDDGITAANSTTVRDGILPALGFDGSGDGISGNQAFRGPTRRGLESLGLGLHYAVFSQLKDPSKPTWTFGAELRLSIGSPMRFDRSQPTANTSVAPGYHELYLSTTMSRRLRWAEPYVSFAFAYPFIAGDSQFQDLGRSQESVRPQPRLSTLFGSELIVHERPATGRRVALDLRGRIEAHLEGRAYSPLWEVLASAPALGVDVDGDGTVDRAFGGVTDVENYMTLSGSAAVAITLSRTVQCRLGGEVIHNRGHAISVADAGRDLDGSGRVDRPPEGNPQYQPLVDLPGRRYRAEDQYTINVFANVTTLF